MINLKNTILKSISTILIITTITYISISNSITTNNLKTTSKNLVKSGLIYNEDKTYTDVFNTILKLTPLTEEQVIKMIKLDYVEEILNNIVNNIYEYNLTKDETIKYKEQDIISLVENNIVKITTDIDYYLSETDKTKAINYTKKNINYILKTIYQTKV